MELNWHETLYGSLKVYIFFVSDQKIMMAAIIRHWLLGKIGFSNFKYLVFKNQICAGNVTWKEDILRDRPFNLKGGGLWFFCFIFFLDNTRVRILIFFVMQCEIFFLNSILGYMSKTLNQIIFFSSTKIRIFFSGNIGNQNIFLEKNHNPPLQVKGIRYSSKGR